MRSMLSTCPSPSLTALPVAPVAALATAPLPDPLAPAPPPRARFRRLVVFDGRIA
jgi:hypothetical protein